MTDGRLRLLLIAVTAAGLAISLWLLAGVGFGAVFGIVGRIGVAGFLLYCGFTLVVLSVLGLAHALIAGRARQLGIFIWGRTVREAATDVLPFSQLGGIVIGARSLIAARLPQPLVYASLVADQTSELGAQLAYTMYGVIVLSLVLQDNPAGGDVQLLAFVGLGVSIAIILAFIAAQRPLLLLAARIASAILPASAAALVTVGDELRQLYADRRALAGCLLLHLVAWVGSGAGAWIALRLVGAEIPVGSVIVVEGLIFTLRTAAFFIPGAIGLQEGAYVLIGPLFGLSAEAALALSLMKRARDLAIGLPVMLLWQWRESRALLRRDPDAQV